MTFNYSVLLSLHLVSVISWFAGLLYIVRLFIYHQETTLSRPDHEKTVLQAQFIIMEKRLWYGITNPAMMASIFFGLWMLILNPILIQQPWMLLKLTMIVFLLLYHQICGYLRKKLIPAKLTWTSTQLRAFNEVGTILLIGIVFSVITKNVGTVFKALAVFLILGLVIFKIVQTVRSKKEKSPDLNQNN